MYYLDTCICIDFLRGRLKPGFDFMRRSRPDDFRLPSVVAAELWFGAEHSANPEKNLQIVETFIDTFTIASFDADAARVMAQDPDCKVIAEGDLLVVLLCVGASTGSRRLANSEERVFDLVKNLETQVGVSRKFFDLLGVAGAFDEAKIALQYGKLRFKDFMLPGENYEDNPKTCIYRFRRYAPFFVGDSDPDKNSLLRRHNHAVQMPARCDLGSKAIKMCSPMPQGR